jgi:hypothetical protein
MRKRSDDVPGHRRSEHVAGWLHRRRVPPRLRAAVRSGWAGPPTGCRRRPPSGSMVTAWMYDEHVWAGSVQRCQDEDVGSRREVPEAGRGLGMELDPGIRGSLASLPGSRRSILGRRFRPSDRSQSRADPRGAGWAVWLWGVTAASVAPDAAVGWGVACADEGRYRQAAIAQGPPRPRRSAGRCRRRR